MAAGRRSDVTRRINLALQGGGAHGAFTWGVLDRLLDEEDLEIAGISGTSAGALNGAALKSGWLIDGRDGARENLDWLWRQMGAIDAPAFPEWMGIAQMSNSVGSSLPYLWAESLERMISPYATGPFYTNPLRRVAERFDYDRVCAHDGPRLFVGATNVRSGKIRVFEGGDISTDALLASACLPTLFRAVEIDGEAYWDGGYTGNPALFPLFAPDLPGDIVIVNINPLERNEVPRTPQDIRNRINEISFNSSLLREMRAIAFAQRLLDEGRMKRGEMKQLNLHMIADDALMNELSVATKIVPIPDVIARLKAAGRQAAQAFLDAHGDDLGQRGSVDLAGIYG
ncbi:patatin-like phospholipase family protein [Aquicoccus porphyridii]|uniref:Patatin-like phospholipase family protein n=1 Tax=Aquicoccus porphyridii TaxID=1852029 RepID=A0A5A9ZUR9_9RHOB|nr:patatin-like phospholipase family protein [Aquicoccus porphyridii]KAA0920919.1 patatin-like phospholipase family protein [Aquicoccus porphyridii]RAI56541.1 patatin-like phospholipase family protein [Rhodobacteraceae bacterium AsT-22]